MSAHFRQGDCRLLLGDCLDWLPTLDAGSVDLTVTSPPYDNLRTYNGTLNDWTAEKWQAVICELYRITKDGGVVVWVVGDATIKGSETGTSFRQALYAMECGFRLHDTMIWRKTNPMPTQRSRYEQAFEFMFVLAKGKPEGATILTEPCSGRWRRKKHEFTGGNRENGGGYYDTKQVKIRHNVWDTIVGGGAAQGKHPAAFPDAIARDHILSWSNPGDTVLDPFLGSGTTAKMALQHGREFIGIEREPQYFEIALRRIDGATRKDGAT